MRIEAIYTSRPGSEYFHLLYFPANNPLVNETESVKAHLTLTLTTRKYKHLYQLSHTTTRTSPIKQTPMAKPLVQYSLAKRNYECSLPFCNAFPFIFFDVLLSSCLKHSSEEVQPYHLCVKVHHVKAKPATQATITCSVPNAGKGFTPHSPPPCTSYPQITYLYTIITTNARVAYPLTSTFT